MSRRRAIEEHRRNLEDIRGILAAMRNLALMETQKLTAYLGTLGRIARHIEATAAEFFAAHPEERPRPEEASRLYVLVGSERGFCGDFNEALVEGLAAEPAGAPARAPRVVAVGSRLCEKLEEDHRVVARLTAPTVSEEIPSALVALVDALQRAQGGEGRCDPLDLTILHQSPEAGGAKVVVRRPLAGLEGAAPRRAYPPVLTLPPRVFVASLMEQYLLAVLYDAFSRSLMAEHQRRFQQMDQALQHLDKQTAALRLRSNSLRQEEITEEIEVIMLSAQSLAES